MIETRDEIPLEEIDKRIIPGKYMLIRTGGYHPYAKLKVEKGDEHYKKPIWPYVKKLNGYHQKLNEGGKMNGSISAKKPYVNLTVYKADLDKNGRLERVKTYFHIIVAKAFCNPNNLIHQQDGGDYVINHKNFKTVDYRIENLEFVTSTENSIGYPAHRRISRQIMYAIHKLAKYA
jgi:hypothetical protein|tara:strand:+ start:34 stop:561 length:528 start_codon:yes stop_codon:yes gene_type:complete